MDMADTTILSLFSNIWSKEKMCLTGERFYHMSNQRCLFWDTTALLLVKDVSTLGHRELLEL